MSSRTFVGTFKANGVNEYIRLNEPFNLHLTRVTRKRCLCTTVGTMPHACYSFRRVCPTKGCRVCYTFSACYVDPSPLSSEPQGCDNRPEMSATGALYRCGGAHLPACAALRKPAAAVSDAQKADIEKRLAAGDSLISIVAALNVHASVVEKLQRAAARLKRRVRVRAPPQPALQAVEESDVADVVVLSCLEAPSDLAVASADGEPSAKRFAAPPHAYISSRRPVSTSELPGNIVHDSVVASIAEAKSMESQQNQRSHPVPAGPRSACHNTTVEDRHRVSYDSNPVGSNPAIALLRRAFAVAGETLRASFLDCAICDCWGSTTSGPSTRHVAIRCDKAIEHACAPAFCARKGHAILSVDLFELAPLKWNCPINDRSSVASRRQPKGFDSTRTEGCGGVEPALFGITVSILSLRIPPALVLVGVLENRSDATIAAVLKHLPLSGPVLAAQRHPHCCVASEAADVNTIDLQSRSLNVFHNIDADVDAFSYPLSPTLSSQFEAFGYPSSRPGADPFSAIYGDLAASPGRTVGTCPVTGHATGLCERFSTDPFWSQSDPITTIQAGPSAVNCVDELADNAPSILSVCPIQNPANQPQQMEEGCPFVRREQTASISSTKQVDESITHCPFLGSITPHRDPAAPFRPAAGPHANAVPKTSLHLQGNPQSSCPFVSRLPVLSCDTNSHAGRLLFSNDNSVQSRASPPPPSISCLANLSFSLPNVRWVLCSADIKGAVLRCWRGITFVPCITAVFEDIRSIFASKLESPRGDSAVITPVQIQSALQDVWTMFRCTSEEEYTKTRNYILSSWPPSVAAHFAETWGEPRCAWWLGHPQRIPGLPFSHLDSDSFGDNASINLNSHTLPSSWPLEGLTCCGNSASSYFICPARRTMTPLDLLSAACVTFSRVVHMRRIPPAVFSRDNVDPLVVSLRQKYCVITLPSQVPESRAVALRIDNLTQNGDSPNECKDTNIHAHYNVIIVQGHDGIGRPIADDCVALCTCPNFYASVNCLHIEAVVRVLEGNCDGVTDFSPPKNSLPRACPVTHRTVGKCPVSLSEQ